MITILRDKKKLIIYTTIFIILSAISVLAIYMFFFRDKNNNHDITENFYIDLAPIVVELKIPVTQDKKEYLKMHLTLLVSSSKSEKTEKQNYLNSKIPMIQDAIVVFFSSLSVFDLKNKRNFIYLKETLLSRINKVIQPYFIDEVLFREFVTGF